MESCLRVIILCCVPLEKENNKPLAFLNCLLRTIGVFPKWNRNSVNSANLGNLINQGSMKWG